MVGGGKGLGGKREESKMIPQFLNLGDCEDSVAINTSLAEKLIGNGVDNGNFFYFETISNL